jgi:hypothetical protein
MQLHHSRPSLTSSRGEPNPLTAEDLHLREHIEFLDRIVRADVDARIAKLRDAGHPKAQALEGEYLRLNARLRTAFLAFGKSIEDLERFERHQLAPASPTPQSAVESPSFE